MAESIKSEIEKICKKFFNNQYKSYILSKQLDIPKINNSVDIKDIIFYYVNYVWHTEHEIDTYFNDNADYVLIPNDDAIKKVIKKGNMIQHIEPAVKTKYVGHYYEII